MYKKFVLKHFPSNDFPEDLSCFDLTQANFNDLVVQEGFALLRVVWISSDPLLRTWISGARSYLEPVGPGSSIPSFGVGRVMKVVKKQGKKTSLQPNDWVFGMLEWSQFMTVDYRTIQKLPISLEEENFKFLTSYGPSGFTAFCSIKKEIQPFKTLDPRTGQPKTMENMNIVISSAAGGIGLTITDYLSKIGYKRIFGIAGTEQKCQAARDFGCKGCINYKKYYQNGEIKAREFEKGLREMMGGQQCDIYYQNVGEDMLSSMLNVMADHSKVIMCGATATYNNWGTKEGVKNFQNVISKRIQLKGILYFDVDFRERVGIFMEMGSFDLKGCEILFKGIEELPTTYRNMIHGKFIGKPVIQLWEDPCQEVPEEEEKQ